MWQVGSNGAGKRHWFVWRKLDNRPQETLNDNRGSVRWFGSMSTAARAAQKANNEHR